MQRVALVVNDGFSAWHFRKGLITALVSGGIDVTIVTPGGAYVPRLTGLGATHVSVRMERFISPLRDIRLCLDLYRVFRSTRPDLVHNMTAKPNIYGAVAARLAGVPRVVALVSGLGYGFSEGGGPKQRILRHIVSRLYRLATRLCDRVWFQNGEDLSVFVESGVIPREKALLIRSGGVNLEEYSAATVDVSELGRLRAELGIDPGAWVVLMVVGRVVWSKGVKEFVEASEYVSRRRSKALFLLMGPLDPGSPDGVPEAYLRQQDPSHFLWIGFRSEVKEILSLAEVVTLPSFYREGVPRALLEALAMGKPVVTTDNVGCREVVEHGKNGLLIPIRDSAALAKAILELLDDEEKRRAFGSYSRAKAAQEFDERKIVQRVLEELYGLAAAEQVAGV